MHLTRLLALVLLLVVSAPLHAAVFTVGTCPGATHSDFATAYNLLGTTGGAPHSLRLCPGSHTTPALIASWGHQGLIIESVSGNPADTELVASAGTVLTAASQDFSVRSLRVAGGFSATGFSNISTTNADVTGAITTAGNLSINNSSIGGGLSSSNGALTLIDSLVSGPIQVQNTSSLSGSSVLGSVTVSNGALTLENGSIEGNLTSNALNATNWDFTGDMSVTAGTINIAGGSIAGNVDGGSQNLTLSGVTMTSGSLQVAGGVISIDASQIGTDSTPVPINANNGITVTDSEIWGDLTAQNWATISLNPATTVFGSCTPEPTGGGTCGAAPSCSSFIGQATINELRRSGGGQQAFIEIRILDLSIPASVWSDWSLRYCSARTGNCQTNALGSAVVDSSGYPWLVLTEAGMINTNDISLGTPGGGIEVRLDDADGRPIDYLSVDGHEAGLAEACTYPFDTTMAGSNAFGIMRLPDGVGDWMTGGPGNSGGDPTPGAPNDGILPALPVLEILMEQPVWSGTPGEVLDTSGRGLHGTAEGSANTAVTSPALPGNPGTCRYGEFDGVDSGIAFGSADLELAEEMTVMAWVRWGIPPDDGDSWATIVTLNQSADRGQFWLQHRQDNAQYEFAIEIQAEETTRPFVRSSATPLQGEWQHVAAVYDGNQMRIYVNGDLSGSRDQTGLLRQRNNHVLNIGRWQPAARRFNGNIDEVRVFDRALNLEQIRDWMNTRHPCEEQPLNHIRLEHSGAGLTCQAETITVRACADTDCSQLFSDPVTVNFTSPGGNWTPSALNFTEQASVGLQVTEAGSVLLNAASDPAAPVRCFVGGSETCAMDWAEAGFVIDLPDHISATTADGVIRAVRASDDAQACVPAFADVTRPVNLWSEYLNPDSGLAAVSVNNTALPGNDPGTTFNLDFDSDGAASLAVVYPDAGRMRIQARFEGTGDEAGLVMNGQGQFVARPAQLVVAVDGNPETDSATGTVFRAAGESFDVRVQALNVLGNLTGNFGRESAPETATVGLDHELVAPAGGHLAGLVGNLHAFGQDCTGQPGGIAGQACGQFQWHEVGSLGLIPSLISGPYLGFEVIPGASSAAVGRFIPSRFSLGGSSLTDRVALTACSSDFTYLGEALGIEFTLIAQSTDGLTTRNYEGAYARMDASQLNLGASPAPGISGAALVWQQGMGSAGASLTPPRNGPDGPHDPYTVTTAPVDSDGVGLVGNNVIGSTRLVFGRMVIENAIGSELGPVDLPWRIEFWNDQTWQANSADSCTVLDLDNHVSLRNGHGDQVSGSDAIAVTGSGAVTSIDQTASEMSAVAGRGHFRLSAPLAPGWVEVLLGLDNGWPFLRDDLTDDGNHDNEPEARATWGLFDGSPNRILLREVTPR